MYWFYLILMFALTAFCSWGAYGCVKNWWVAPIYFVGTIVLIAGAVTTFIFGIRAIAYSNLIERSDVMVTNVTTTIDNGAPMKVTLKGVYADKTSAYYICDNPFTTEQCAQLRPGVVVVFVEAHNELGFSQTTIEFPDSSTRPK